jgi:hypothetical protein
MSEICIFNQPMEPSRFNFKEEDLQEPTGNKNLQQRHSLLDCIILEHSSNDCDQNSPRIYGKLASSFEWTHACHATYLMSQAKKNLQTLFLNFTAISLIFLSKQCEAQIS